MASQVEVQVALERRPHLRDEMARLLERLARHLQQLRRRGRTPGTEVVQSLVIEDGEAEGLVAELAEFWCRPRTLRNETPHHRPSWISGTGTDRVWMTPAYQAEAPLYQVARAFEVQDRIREE